SSSLKGVICEPQIFPRNTKIQALVEPGPPIEMKPASATMNLMVEGANDERGRARGLGCGDAKAGAYSLGQGTRHAPRESLASARRELLAGARTFRPAGQWVRGHRFPAG